jgi:hypothetical protein
MMNMPPLSLTQERATRLLAYVQMYRRLALTQIAPSTERNAIQRQLQALQGKLMHREEREQQETIYHLSVTSEDIAALKTMVADLLVLTTREPATVQRDITLVDLASLKGTLEKLSLYGQKKSYTKTLL